VTGEVLKTFDELTPEQLENKLARAATAAESYRLTTIEQRAEWLGRAADHLERDADSVSELITTEMGKTYRAAQDEVAKCVHGLRFYAADWLVRHVALLGPDAGGVGRPVFQIPGSFGGGPRRCSR
jgi:succinate-semialdehyde dehydrogenase/glutarate-semialdehyde dehydrogenase